MAHVRISLSALLEAHPMDALVNVGVFLGHHLVDDRTALLLATLLVRSHSARPKLERLCFPFLQHRDHPSETHLPASLAATCCHK